MQLGEADKRALVEDGFLIVRGAVPRDRIDAALRAINLSLGEEGIAKDQIWTLRAQTFCPELVGAPPILDLYTETPLAALAAAGLGPGNVAPPTTGQIALRFPQIVAEPRDPYPHIDGMPGPLNGVEAGTLYTFSALGAVFLSDVPAPFRGNFTVWPGSQRLLEAHFRAHGTDDLLRGFPPLAMPAPRQLIVRAGDVLLAHHALAHGAAANLGPHVRYAVFFRLSHRNHDPGSTTALTDLWRHWDGLNGA
ncbi:MAG TPA: phytanoyl-CoA dioxygenase family protein [Polyangia bacterium]|nr:phytanoyl-CoA dioxygenase family protein [Polyangia bacterium]